MAGISQATIVAMINTFEHLGCYDSTSNTTYHSGPIITATGLRKFLYSSDFDIDLLTHFEKMDWDFARILPKLRDNSFWTLPNHNWLAKAEIASANQERGETVLRTLAAALIELCSQRRLTDSSVYKILVLQLRRDGFVFSAGKIIESDSEVVDLPAEQSAVEKTISASKHDDVKTVLHHLSSAQKQMTDSEWGAASGEWRKLFEEVVRGVWRLTRLKNPSFAGRIEQPPFKDVLLWLEQAQFFTEDEKEVYGAAWKFLSVVNHPGLTEEDTAKFCRTLALTFGHAALTKLDWWTVKRFGNR